MNAENLIISDVNKAFINSVNDNRARWVDIYAIAEDIRTKENKKIKIRISGEPDFQFSEVSDEEWETALI